MRIPSSFCGNCHDEQARVCQAVAKFGLKDKAKVTKDILVFLPSFDSNNNNDYGCARDGAATNCCRCCSSGQRHRSRRTSRRGKPSKPGQSRPLELSDFACREDQLLRF
jgi:hypothetical protein